jgi:hypothetical protein
MAQIDWSGGPRLIQNVCCRAEGAYAIANGKRVLNVATTNFLGMAAAASLKVWMYHPAEGVDVVLTHILWHTTVHRQLARTPFQSME